MPKIVNAYLYTYIGIEFGASHWQIELQGGKDFDYKIVVLSHRLTSVQASQLNKRVRAIEIGAIYQKGDMYDGFDSREEAIATAVTEWQKHFPKAEILVLGKSIYVEPKPVLATVFDRQKDAQIKAGAEHLSKQYKLAESYAASDSTLDELYGQWVYLLGES